MAPRKKKSPPPTEVEPTATEEFDEEGSQAKDPPPDDEAKITVEEAKARGALQSKAMEQNKKNERIKKRKLKGDKYIGWNEEGPVLYAQIIDVYGAERIRVHVKKTAPTSSDCGSIMMSNATEYDALRQWIVDNYWDGKKATFHWTALKNGSARLGADDMNFDEDPAQQKRWAEKIASAQQTGTQQPAQQQAPQTQMQQPQIVVQQQPSSPSQEGLLNALMSKLDRIESGVAAQDRSRDDEEEEEEEEESDGGSLLDTLPRRRQPPRQDVRQQQPAYVPAQQPQTAQQAPMETPKQDEPQFKWEQVSTPAGGVAWIKKPVIPMPPTELPEPLPGYAWQYASGHWVQVPTDAPRPQQAPVVPAQAPQRAPVVQQAQSAEVRASEESIQRERDLLSELHRNETELEVLRERYKWMGELAKVKNEVASMASAAASAHVTQQQLQPAQVQQQVQPAAQTSGLPQPPPGYAYTQTTANGPWVLLQLQAPQPPAQPPTSPSQQINDMADTLKNLNSFANAARSVFPNPKGDGPAQAAMALAAAAADSDDGAPLGKIDAGGWQMWFDKDTKKPADGLTQFALNLGNVREAAKGVIGEAIDGYSKIVDKQEEAKSKKLERDRLEMADVIKKQREQISRVERQLQIAQEDRHRQQHANHDHQDVGPFASDEPQPAPTQEQQEPPAMVVADVQPGEQPAPAPPQPSTSMAAGAMAAFRRKP